jgi:hypothetical protein
MFVSWRDERGQVAPLLALFAVAIGLACFGLGRFGAGAVSAASARTAADAAALAGAVGGKEAAAGLARENGGRLESFEAAGGDVRVRVRVGAHVVAARARSSASVNAQADLPAAALTNGLAPAMRAALARAEQLLGGPVPVTSGFRSAREQARLWDRRATNRYPVAPPGTSMHERGLAIDVASAFAGRLAAVGRDAGLCRPFPATDPVHFELCDRRLPPSGAG